MQVDPLKFTLKAPGSERLKLKCDKLHSNFAFNFNLRRYIEAGLTWTIGKARRELCDFTGKACMRRFKSQAA